MVVLAGVTTTLLPDNEPGFHVQLSEAVTSVPTCPPRMGIGRIACEVPVVAVHAASVCRDATVADVSALTEPDTAVGDGLSWQNSSNRLDVPFQLNGVVNVKVNIPVTVGGFTD